MTPLAYTKLPLSELAFSVPTITAKGLKASQLTNSEGQTIYWRPEDGSLEVPFEPASYDGTPQTRVGLCLRPTASLARELDALADAVILYASDNSIRLFGKALSLGEVRDRFSPLLHEKENFPPLFRVKLIQSGVLVTNCWDMAYMPRASPDKWKGCLISPRLRLRGLWFQGSSFGLTIELADALIQEDVSAPVCPF